jgi:hypothetical protein
MGFWALVARILGPAAMGHLPWLPQTASPTELRDATLPVAQAGTTTPYLAVRAPFSPSGGER